MAPEVCSRSLIFRVLKSTDSTSQRLALLGRTCEKVVESTIFILDLDIGFEETVDRQAPGTLEGFCRIGQYNKYAKRENVPSCFLGSSTLLVSDSSTALSTSIGSLLAFWESVDKLGGAAEGERVELLLSDLFAFARERTDDDLREA